MKKKALLAAAFSGMLLGSSAALAEDASSHDEGQGRRIHAGAQRMADSSKDKEKHACKGQNSCKGKGGCKTDKHACKGQNDCKGQGGCATDGSKK